MFSKGNSPWNKGIKTGQLSETTRRKMSLSRKGKNPYWLHTNEISKKISLSNKGRKAWNKGIKTGFLGTEETRIKLSLSHKDKIPHKPLSEESRKRLSLLNKGKPRSKPFSKEHNQKISLSKKGKPLSENHKKKLSLAKRGKPWSEKKRNQMISSNLMRSKPEILFGELIYKYFGIELEHSKYLDGKIFDYCYEPGKTLFECDGTYYHSMPNSIINDQFKNKIALDNGYILQRYNLDTLKQVEPLIKEEFNRLKNIFSNV